MSINKIKTIFIGTSDFAIPALRSLVNSKQFEIKEVITQADKKTGRKQIISSPPLKIEALRLKIPVTQPENISEHKFSTDIDLIVVVAYGQILSDKIINIPKYGVINIHGSLLPKYRGAACVQAAIISGDDNTGVTFMKMDTGLDTGPILKSVMIKIMPSDTGGSLYSRLSGLGGEHIKQTLLDYINKKITPRPQDESKSSYAGKLKKQDGLIDFNKPAKEIERFIRAMQPWPGSFAKLETDNNQSTVKITKVLNRIIKVNKYKTGELFLHNNNPAMQCGSDALIIEKLQLEGKKEISGQDFIKGYSKYLGHKLK